MRKCYLYVTVRPNLLNPLVPEVCDVGVLSEPPLGATGRFDELRCEIYALEGKDYQEAHDRMFELVKTHPSFQWLWHWLDPSREGHDKRFPLYEEISEQRQAQKTELKLRKAHMEDALAGKFEVPPRAP